MYQFVNDQGPVATLPMQVYSDLHTYLANKADLDLAALFPQTVGEPASWSADSFSVLFAEAQQALTTLQSNLPPVSASSVTVVKPESDLTPEEVQLLTQVPHQTTMLHEQAMVSFQQPNPDAQAALDAQKQLAAARHNLDQVQFFVKAGVDAGEGATQLVLVADE